MARARAKVQEGKFKWEVGMPPPSFQVKSGITCSLRIEQKSNNSTISAIDKKHLSFVFGDIWFCAGQSNMNWAMRELHNAKTAIQKGMYFNMPQ